jgi:alanyl-tRNA synthetase
MTIVTERIYYTDPTCAEFEATVTSSGTVDGRTVVTLDRTAFYPTSGGQPHDTGWLGDAQVADVLDLDDGGIGHIVNAPLADGTRIRGRVDWARRFDHMQQHTGQHVLSAAFDRLHRARTVGFHLGAALSTVDLDKVLDASALASAESEANRIVWEDRPVSIRFATPEEAAGMAFRKEPTRTGPLRVIEIRDFDMSACGGTHVARAGEVGVVALRSWEKFRGGMRIEFACGARALREFRVLRDAVAGSLRCLSVAPQDLPSAIEGAQAENKELRRTLRDLGERLAVHEAGALVARAQPIGGASVVVEALEGWDQAGLKALASAAAGRPGMVAALFSAGEPALVVIARATDVNVDAAALLKSLLGRFGGKGGGKPDLAQGGGLAGSRADLIAAAVQIIAASLQPGA